MGDTEIRWSDLDKARLRFDIRPGGRAADVTVLSGPNAGAVYRDVRDFPDVVGDQLLRAGEPQVVRRLTEMVDVEQTHILWSLDRPEKWADVDA